MLARKITIVATAIATLLTVVAVGQANAAAAGDGYITPYTKVNQRRFPTSESALNGTLRANERVLGFCWTRGQRVGTNNIWIATAYRTTGSGKTPTSFVAAYYLKGDERGGVDEKYVC